MAKAIKPDKRLERTITLSRAEDKIGAYTLSFSSEEPYGRWFGPEILDHSENAVDMSRLQQMGVVLFNHDRNRVIGRVTSAQIINSRGEAEIMFDADDDSALIQSKVDAGTLRGVSVGYSVDAWEEVAAGKTSADGKYTGPVYIARKWTPLEISIVSIPADPTVGVGRDLEINNTEEDKHMDETRTSPANGQPEQEHEEQRQQETPDVASTQNAETEGYRIGGRGVRTFEEGAAIAELCRDFGVDPVEHLRSGHTIEQVRTSILDNMRTTHAGVRGAVTLDEGDKFRSAAVDALLIRSGIVVDKPAAGASEMRGVSLEKLAVRSLRDAGIDASMMSRDAIFNELMRQYLSPTMAFPSILDDTLNKSYAAGWRKAPVTYDIWTAKGTLNDFKESDTQYVTGSAGELLLVPEGGELKHDIPKDYLLPKRKLHTYGRQFTMSRQAFINDDIGFVTTLPARWARSSRMTINKQVYSILVTNPAIFDGVPLYETTQHKNLIDPGTAPSKEAVQAMVKLMALQTDPEGEAISIMPKWFITPMGLGDDLRTLFGSPAYINVNTMQMQNNPLAGRGYEVVEEPMLNTLGNAISYYAMADQMLDPTIQVDYLNGMETPTIQMSTPTGQLGFIWDIYMDWGISVLDYRSTVKNEGE